MCPTQERWEEPDVEYFEHSRGSGGSAHNTTEDDLEINGSKARDGKVGERAHRQGKTLYLRAQSLGFRALMSL